MSTLNSLNRNILRLSGLNSGLDTENIIKGMMKIDQQKVDKQFRAQAKMEWQVEAHQSVNNILRKLKDDYTTTLKQEQNMLSEYNYRKYSMTYQNTSDSAYVSMSAAPHASEGTVTVNNIYQLAKAATAETTTTVTNGGDGLNLTWTMYQVNDALKAAGKSGFTTQGEPGSEKLVFELEGKEYSVSMYSTLDSVLNSINANSTTMKISYTQLTDKFSISAKTEGKNSSLTVESSNFLTQLGIAGGTYKNGQNAKLEINGHLVERSSNRFEIDGINYTLKQITVDPNSVTPTTTDAELQALTKKNINVDITRDLDSTVKMIKGYVDAYNEMLDTLQGLLSEKVDRDYYPLTEEERAELTEAEIEKWETSAKKGLMRNDSQLSNLIMQMRMSFYTKIPGSSLMMADIGLGGVATSVEAAESARKGHITLDETKLREALRSNPDMVYQMFTADSASGNVDEMGLARRMNKLITDYTTDNVANTQYYANMNIARAKERYVDMVNAMYTKEEQLWKRFTALETAMSNLNSQNTWLQQQLSSINGSK